MPACDFPLNARFFLKADDDSFASAEEAAGLIRDRFPRAVIDWELGRKHVEDRIARLREMRCPEIILEGDKRLLDRTVFVAIDVPDSGSRLEGYTWGFSFYDGCIGFDCKPFDTAALKRGAHDFAEKMDLDFELFFGSVGDINLTVVPGAPTVHAIVERRFAGCDFGKPNIVELGDWGGCLYRGVAAWFKKHPERQVTDRWLAGSESIESIASGLIERLQSIDEVRKTFRVYFADGKGHDNIVACYDLWTAILNLPGVPAPLFADCG